ncbi:MAG TPA: hypothetical protein VF086_21810 [Propionibacteriaceae bacterium]
MREAGRSAGAGLAAIGRRGNVGRGGSSKTQKKSPLAIDNAWLMFAALAPLLLSLRT